MKKIFIIVIAIFAALGIAISSMLISASRVSRLLRESDDHLRGVIVDGISVTAEVRGGEEEETLLSPGSVDAFLTAVTRTGLLNKYLPPGSGENTVVVTFGDGAEYTVIDGGTGKDGKDITYIIYRFEKHTYYYKLSGYRTYERVLQCVSPEGYNGENRPAGAEDD